MPARARRDAPAARSAAPRSAAAAALCEAGVRRKGGETRVGADATRPTESDALSAAVARSRSPKRRAVTPAASAKATTPNAEEAATSDTAAGRRLALSSTASGVEHTTPRRRKANASVSSKPASDAISHKPKRSTGPATSSLKREAHSICNCWSSATAKATFF